MKTMNERLEQKQRQILYEEIHEALIQITIFTAIIVQLMVMIL